LLASQSYCIFLSYTFGDPDAFDDRIPTVFNRFRLSFGRLWWRLGRINGRFHDIPMRESAESFGKCTPSTALTTQFIEQDRPRLGNTSI
jgi:hypothetical protein